MTHKDAWPISCSGCAQGCTHQSSKFNILLGLAVGSYRVHKKLDPLRAARGSLKTPRPTLGALGAPGPPAGAWGGLEPPVGPLGRPGRLREPGEVSSHPWDPWAAWAARGSLGRPRPTLGGLGTPGPPTGARGGLEPTLGALGRPGPRTSARLLNYFLLPWQFLAQGSSASWGQGEQAGGGG